MGILSLALVPPWPPPKKSSSLASILYGTDMLAVFFFLLDSSQYHNRCQDSVKLEMWWVLGEDVEVGKARGLEMGNEDLTPGSPSEVDVY